MMMMFRATTFRTTFTLFLGVRGRGRRLLCEDGMIVTKLFVEAKRALHRYVGCVECGVYSVEEDYINERLLFFPRTCFETAKDRREFFFFWGGGGSSIGEQ